MCRRRSITGITIFSMTSVVCNSGTFAQQFLAQPDAAHICATDDISFEATVDFQSGVNPLFTWQYDDGTGGGYTTISDGDRAGRITIVSDLTDESNATTTLTITDADFDMDRGFYRVRATIDGGQATSQPAGLTFIAPTTVDPTAMHETVCVDSSTQLESGVMGKGGEFFNWSVLSGPNLSFGQFDPSQIVSAPTFTPTDAGSYVLQISAIGATCDDIATDTVNVTAVDILTVNPTPTTTTTCLESPVTLMAGAEGGSGSFDYNWTVIQGPNANPTQFSAIDTPNPSFTPTSETLPDQPYVLQVVVTPTSSTVSCAEATATVTIHVNTTLTVDATPDTAEMCAQENIGLNATSNDTDADYAWTIDPTSPDLDPNQIVNPDSNAALFTPTTSGDYIIHLNATSGACTPASDTVTITVFDQPTVAIDPIEDPEGMAITLCITDAIELTSVTTGSDQQNYTWSVVSGPDSSNAQFSVTDMTDTTFTPSAAGNYVLRLSVLDSFCLQNVSDTISFTIFGTVSAAPATVDDVTNICVSQSVNLAANPTGGDDEFFLQWSILDGPDTSTAQFTDEADPPDPDPTTIENPVFTPTAAGDYTLQLVVDADIPGDGVCESLDSVYFVSVTSSDTLMLSPDAEFNPTVMGVPTELRPNALGGVAPEFTWSIALRPPDCVDPNPIDANGIFTGNCLGQYRISILAEDDSCDSATSSFDLDVIEFASEPTANPEVICVGVVGFGSTLLSPGILGGMAQSPDLNYSWTIDSQPAGASAEIDNELAETPNLTVFITGTYVLTVEVTSTELPTTFGTINVLAVDDTDEIEITTHPQDDTACESEEITLNVVASGNGPTYQWRRNSIDLPGMTEDELVLTNLTLADTGVYDCAVTGPCGVIVTSDPATVTVTPFPDRPPLLSVSRIGTTFFELEEGCQYSGTLIDTGDLAGNVTGATGLASHPSLQDLYAAVRVSGSNVSWLASVDRNSGVATVLGQMKVGENGQRIFDIAFDPDSSPPVLYGIQGNDIGSLDGDLFTIDLATAELTPVANISSFGAGEGQSITISGGFLYHHARVSGNGILTRVSLTDGGIPETLRTYSGAEAIEWSAMIYAESVFLAATTFGELWTIDPSSNYDVLSVGDVDDGGVGSLFLTGLSFSSAACIDTPVAITDPPVDLAICEFLPASFTVVATGTAPITYQWQRDGQPISGATSPVYTIPSVSMADVGIYTAVVSNTCGSVTTPPATLTVQLPPSGDFDLDCNVDLTDFALFDGCITGPVDPILPGCENMDLDANDRIDILDFAILQTTFTP